MTENGEAAASDDDAGAHEDSESRSFQILQLNLARIDAAVDGEYEENDRRLNWFLLFQAFLFQGYATALQAITGAQDHDSEVKHAAVLMMIIIAIGFITSWLTLVATRAGIIATERLKRLREEKFAKLADTLKITTAGWFNLCDPLHHKGLLPTKWGPMIILIAWILVAAHASLSCVVLLATT
jgi:hypothetical protein